MELTVLGSSASFPAAGGACSGYLVRHGESRVLLDCGSGVLPRLLSECRLDQLSAIVITHFHPDHYLDLIPMRYGLVYGVESIGRPRLVLPPDGRAFLSGVGAAMRNAPEMFNEAFEIEEFQPDRPLRIGDFDLSFQQTTHDVPTWALSLECGARFVYTADTRESRELEALAQGADLLLCDATYPDLDPLPSTNHLTGSQAGSMARGAGVDRLVLTHIWPGIDREQLRSEASETFGGPVVLAEPGLRIDIGVIDQTGAGIRERAVTNIGE